MKPNVSVALKTAGRATRIGSAVAALLAALALAGCASVNPSLMSFTTDGCSLFPDRAPAGRADWCDCCLAHDLAYWRGGTEDDRLNADRALRRCVEQRSRDHGLAELMFLGVRAGGGPELNTRFRWGYGWPFGRGYAALTPDEAASVKRLEEAYLATNPTLQCSPAAPPGKPAG